MCSIRSAAFIAALAFGLPGGLAQPYDPSYSVEIHSGPLIGPPNVVGMGGAYVAVAEGSGAVLWNPAAVANRYHHERDDFFSWDWSFDFLLLGAGGAVAVDLENSGRRRDGYASSELVHASLGFNFGRLGLGLNLQAREFGLCQDRGVETCPLDRSFRYESGVAAVSAGWSFFDGALVAGVQTRAPTATFRYAGRQLSGRFTGGGASVGALWRPVGRAFRLGLTARGAATATRKGAGDNATIDEHVLPDRLTVPWEISAGVAWSFGERPLNPRMGLGAGAAAAQGRAAARAYRLVSAELIVIGPSRRAVGGGSWVEQVIQRAGERPDLGARLGAESEVLDNRLRVRVGSYYEPSRFEQSSGRVHGTAGFDVRLFEWIWEWRFTGGVDAARDYLNTMLSVGFWH